MKTAIKRCGVHPSFKEEDFVFLDRDNNFIQFSRHTNTCHFREWDWTLKYISSIYLILFHSSTSVKIWIVMGKKPRMKTQSHPSLKCAGLELQNISTCTMMSYDVGDFRWRWLFENITSFSFWNLTSLCKELHRSVCQILHCCNSCGC